VAERLVIDAFDTKERLSTTESERRIFDVNVVAESIASEAEQANEFLSVNLDLAGDDARIQVGLIGRSLSDIRGSAAWQRRGLANALRALGSLGTATSAVLCPWPCQSPRWWPGKVLAVVSR